MSEYTWEDAARDLALSTRVTHLEAEALMRPLLDTPLDPYVSLYVLRTIIDSTGATLNTAALGQVVAKVSRAGIPPKPYMKPGTLVLARRFGREIKAQVSASGGSTFTVASVEEGDYTVWSDMTFDDVTIVEIEAATPA